MTAILGNLVAGFENLKESQVKLMEMNSLSDPVPATVFILELIQDGKKEEMYLIDAKADGTLPLMSSEPGAWQAISIWSQENPQWREIKAGCRLTGIPIMRRWNVIRGLPPKARLLNIDSRTTLPKSRVALASLGIKSFDWRISVSNPFDSPLNFSFELPEGKSKSVVIPGGEEMAVEENLVILPDMFPLKAVLRCGNETFELGEDVVTEPFDYWGELF